MLVDIHTHSNHSADSHPAIRNLTFDEAEDFFRSDKQELCSVGIHPWHAETSSEDILSKLEEWSKDKRFFAIGECGLDRNSNAGFEKQLSVFEAQITISEKSNKPLIIHCVGYFNELLALKKKWNPIQLWIIHGFRGKPELAAQVLKSGCALSYGEHFNAESVRLTPTEKLFVEADESTLNISEIYQHIAKIKACKIEDLNAGMQLLNKMTRSQP
jgi:TatD DNase family protein